ncbi:MAG: type V CRISPR-associated protein Cas12d [Candidatus Campbellbacteria bacterium]|nr:type V CRISPR-associated protein Cas12d [Candidatus Campbellbacteria bacterium]
MKAKRSRKYKGMTGYKLHLRRLKYTGGKAIRTIKFPIVFKDESETENLMNQIRCDYEGQVGQFNATTLKDGRGEYSLFDLYLDFLRVGSVFHDNVFKIKSFIDDSANNEVKKDMKKKDLKFFDLIDFDSFNNKIRLSGGVRKKSGEEEIKNIFYGNQDRIEGILSKDKNEEKLKGKTGIFKHSIYIKNRKEVRKYTEQIYKGICKSDGETIKADKQKEFWSKNFGVSFIEKGNNEGALFIHPDFEFAKEDVKEQDLIDRVRKKYGENPISFLAMATNHNPLSYAFNKFLKPVREGDIDKAKEMILNINSDLWKGKEKELEKRLKWLSSRAKLLPETPYMAKSWAEYRTTMGGKLSSWISNTENQKEDIDHVLFGYTKKDKDGKDVGVPGHEEHLKTLLDIIKEKNNKNIDRLKNLTNELINLNKSIKTNLLAKSFDIYSRILGDLRVELNKFIQAQNPEMEEKELKKERNKYKSVFATLPKFPTFPGIRKKEHLTKILNSKEMYKDGLDIIERLRKMLDNDLELRKIEDEDVENEKITLLRRFDTLNNLYKDSTPWAQNIIQKAITTTTGIDIKGLKEKEVFTKYKRRGNWKELELGKNIEEIFDSIPKLIDLLRPDFKKRKLENIREHIDAIELEKIRIGLITYYKKISVSKSDFLKNFSKTKRFEEAGEYLKLQEGKTLDGDKINTILQRYFFAEMKGTLNILSKKIFKERYVVQPMGSGADFPLVFDKKDNLWYIAKKENLSKTKTETDFLQLSDKTKDPSKKKNFIPVENINCGFKIQSSKYQTQFLNESSPFFGNSINKDFDVKISDYSFIGEEDYQIDWSKDQPVFNKVRGSSKIFISIPFELKVKKNLGQKEIKAELEERNRYLGIDVGEYGLAFSLIDIKNKKLLFSWFDYEKGIRKVRERFKENKEKQKAATFTSSNTKLAEIRKSISSSLKNRIHDVAVRYNAIPSYELSISNFETGSSRLTALYKTVKTADVATENNPSEKMTREHVWGTSNFIGVHKSAYGTSYVCTECWRSLYTIRDMQNEKSKKKASKKKETEEVSWEWERINNSKYIKATIDNGQEVYGFLEGDKKKGAMKTKELIKSIQDFARPPIFDVENEKNVKLNSESFKDHPVIKDAFFKKYDNKERKKFYETAGNSGIFVCPFKGCGHISDADIQASLIIGLRAWFKKDKKNTKANFQDEMNKYKDMGFKPVKLNMPRKSFNDIISKNARKK